MHTLVVVGLNHRTAPVEVRDRFWISESRLYEALSQLKRAEGVEEVAVISTPDRTEFILWASETSAGANSVPRFLTREYGLRLCEWERFYRKVDEEAAAHVFRVVCGLDSLPGTAPHVVAQVRRAWQLAQTTGAAGAYLNSLFQQAFALREVTFTGTAEAEPDIEQVVSEAAARFEAGWRSHPAPSVVLQERLEQIGREEVQEMRGEVPEWTMEEHRVLQRLATRITHRIAVALAREFGSNAAAAPDTHVSAVSPRRLKEAAATVATAQGQ